MRFYYIILFIWLVTGNICAQVIPASRCSEWNRAGSDFAFPEPDTLLNVVDFGAMGDGISNDQPAIQNAINALPGRYKVVLIPPGNYLLSSALSLTDSVIFRGAGADSTFLKVNHSSNGINVNGGSAGTLVNVLSGLERGSTKLYVSNSAFFVPGSYAEIREENGSWDSNPATWATYSVGQIVRVDSVAGDTLYLQDPLRISYDTALYPQIRSFIPRRACSIECIHVERTDGNTSGTGYNFSFNYAVNCRMTGIESDKSQGSHCMIGLSSRITVSGCYFHDAYLYDGSGTKGYGVTMNNHAGLCLISNNIFKHLRHAMMTKHGANGNVFAYNYSREPFRNGQLEFPQDYCGDISLHGHYSFANLFEGNIVQTIYIDQTWGPSGPHNTMFRNRIELYGLIMTSSLTGDQNFVGNEITGTGYTFPFNHGAYTLTGNNHLEYGNNDNGTIVPSGTATLNDVSYYLSSQPPFWSIGYPWPPVGAPNAPGSGDIPAHLRYLSGQYTDCSDPGVITFRDEEPEKELEISVYPNPFTDIINIESLVHDQGVSVTLYDISGRMICRKDFPASNCAPVLHLQTPAGLRSGPCLLHVATERKNKVFLMVKH